MYNLLSKKRIIGIFAYFLIKSLHKLGKICNLAAELVCAEVWDTKCVGAYSPHDMASKNKNKYINALQMELRNTDTRRAEGS